jgi:hypothetical protein
MKSAPEKQSAPTASRSGVAWVFRAFAARALVAIVGLTLSVLSVTSTADAADAVGLKISGYFNLTPGSVSHGADGQTGSSVGIVPEGEIELTPQYRLEDGIILAARVAINTNADVGQSFQRANFSIPEVSAFVIGEWERFEVGSVLRFRRVSSGSLPLRSPSPPPSSAPIPERGWILTVDYRRHSYKAA